ncbi:unnamed protein product [Phytophthora fragariaefolia]|uniref:Unnamed protein product n=1 Tax=Phytophthora fragariaefolia TaxID=1490495 RepID=A0A9W7D9K8_9STRA|nr:unnamed protein product [Phytophthora fragariaefolia]
MVLASTRSEFVAKWLGGVSFTSGSGWYMATDPRLGDALLTITWVLDLTISGSAGCGSSEVLKNSIALWRRGCWLRRAPISSRVGSVEIISFNSVWNPCRRMFRSVLVASSSTSRPRCSAFTSSRKSGSPLAVVGDLGSSALGKIRFCSGIGGGGDLLSRLPMVFSVASTPTAAVGGLASWIPLIEESQWTDSVDRPQMDHFGEDRGK